MIRTLPDKNADASLRVLVSTCILGIAITLVYSIWRIQLATVAIREGREYAIRRDAEIWPIVNEIRDNVRTHREFMQRTDAALAELLKHARKPK
jgi:hypothetical protein